MTSVSESSPRFQDRGAVIGVDPSSERIVCATQNTSQIIGFDEDAVLVGQSLMEALGRDVVHAARNAVGSSALKKRRRFLGDFNCPRGPLELEVFVVQDLLIIEISPVTNDPMPLVIDVLQDNDVLTEALIDSAGFDRFVSLLRTMSGYHCVALDRFDQNGSHSMSVAGADDLGQCDIPVSQQLRAVQNLSAGGTELRPRDTLASSDFGCSGLLIPSQSKLDTLQGCGVVACAALGFWHGSELLGRLKFFHRVPRLPNKRTRVSLTLLTPLIEQRLRKIA